MDRSRRDRRSDSRERRRSRSRSREAPPTHLAPAPQGGYYGVPQAAPMPNAFGQHGMAALNPMINAMLQQAVMPNTFSPIVDKAELELFVGNTPPTTSEFVLINFLNAAMSQVQLNTAPGAPIIQCRVSNKYAFIELRSKEEANNALSLNGIPFMGTPLKVGRPSKYKGPHVEAATWQMLTGQATLPTPAPGAGSQSGSGLDPATKVYRELYVGNASPAMADSALAEFLGTTLQKVGMATAPGNPVVSARANGNFAFIELRSIEEANAMLNLNGIPFMGNLLKISRPAKYPGPATPAMTWPDVLARLVAQGDGGAGAGAAVAQAAPAANAAPSAPATRVLRLSNMLSSDDLKDEDGLAEIEEETKTECSSFGPVKRVHIVRPSSAVQGATAAATGVGFVFVEFEEPTAAHAAMLSLSTRTFDGKKVEVLFWDEAKFAGEDYGI